MQAVLSPGLFMETRDRPFTPYSISPNHWATDRRVLKNHSNQWPGFMNGWTDKEPRWCNSPQDMIYVYALTGVSLTGNCWLKLVCVRGCMWAPYTDSLSTWILWWSMHPQWIHHMSLILPRLYQKIWKLGYILNGESQPSTLADFPSTCR